MTVEVKDSWWFTDSYGRTVGIIKTEDTKSGDIKFRIGDGLGFSIETDTEMIIKTGARFYPEIIK